MKFLHMLTGAVVAALEWIVAALFTTLIVLTGVQVFNRFVLNDSVAWAEEISKLLLFYIVFLAGSLAVSRKAFSAFELYKNLPVRFHIYAVVTISLLILLFQGAAFFFGVKMVFLTMSQVTPALEMPQAVMYGAVPLGMLFMFIVTLDSMFSAIKNQGGE